MAGDVKSIDSEEAGSFLLDANNQRDDNHPRLVYIKSVEGDLVKANQAVSSRAEQAAGSNSQLVDRDGKRTNFNQAYRGDGNKLELPNYSTMKKGVGVF